MRRTLFFVLLCELFLISTRAQSPEPGLKLSPQLRMLTSGNPARAAVARRVLLVKTGPQFPQPTVGSFVKFQGDADALRSSFEAYGAKVKTVVGRFATADIPVSALVQVASLPNVLQIDESRRTSPNSDVSIPATGANQIWYGASGPIPVNSTNRGAMPPPWQGNTGQNALIGVVDSGIDLTHKDFIDASGHTRIRALWDQTISQGTPPATIPGHEAFKGNECSSAQIDAIRDQTDLVIADSFDEMMSFLPGTGSGFGGASTFQKGHSSVAFAAADFDLDGNMDLISANLDGTISWVKGNGHGGFSPQNPITVVKNTNAQITVVATGDFNRDGFPDVVAIVNNAKSAAILLGNGDGSFGEPDFLDTGNSPQAVAIADLDGDGFLDLVIGNYVDGTVTVYLGQGDGTFLAHGDFPVSSIPFNTTTGAGQTPSFLAIGDCNGDGIPDLAVADWGRGNASIGFDLSILIGKGNGSFGPPTSINTGFFALSIALGDFNRDGKLDIALESYSTHVTVLLGNGDGTFGTPVNYQAGGSVGFYGGEATLVVGDFNHDGILDIANLVRSLTAPSTTHFYDGLGILIGNGDGTFGAPTVISTGSTGNSTYLTLGNFHASVCTEGATDGHGTHVAGIAAGNGSAGGPGPLQTPYRYMGMAPQAQLAIVKTTHAEDDIVDGVAYIANKAAALGLPAVINLSVGGGLGPHDGTSDYETMLSGLTGPGVVIVASAGNDRDTSVHASGVIANNGTATITLSVPAGITDNVILDMWYPGQDLIGVNVIDPAGDECTASPNFPNNGAEIYFQPNCGTGGIEAQPVNANNGDHELEILLANGGNPLAEGTWSITLKGGGCGSDLCVSNGSFDMWTVQTCNPQQQCIGFIGPLVDPAKSIDVPATANNVIAVGSYVTKTSWIGWGTDLATPVPTTPPATLGTLSLFSSLGPRRTCSSPVCAAPVQKPELAAPGEVVMSSYAAGTPTDKCGYKNGSCRDPDAQHIILAGTSMASPHVAGGVALLMSKYGNLSPCQVKSSLMHTVEAAGGAPPNPMWGYGKLAIDLAILPPPIANINAPDVTGMSLTAAKAAILAANLTVGGITYAGSDTAPLNGVIGQTPVGGTSWCGGVDLVVSGVKVPNVQVMTVDVAKDALSLATLVTGKIIPTPSLIFAPGEAIGSNPAAGTFVAPGSSVDLYISGVEVPDVTGKTKAAATDTISSVQLSAGTVTFVGNSNVTPGKVISEDPVAGTEVLPGSAVNMVVSGIAVPNVTGQTMAVGQSAITGVNLTVGTIVVVVSATVPVGNIITQVPDAGTYLDVASPVIIVVSGATVPNGVGLDLNSAETAITAAGLTVGNVTQAVSPVVQAGLVMNENPGGGSVALPGAPVDLVVSSGPLGQLVVPILVGLSQANAATALTNAGLTLGTVTTAASATIAAGLVISSSPSTGTPVNAGVPVNIVVSTGPPAQLLSIRITPAGPSILAGTSQQFTATGLYSTGATADLTSQVTWAATGAMTISNLGRATSSAIGSSTISATLGTVTSSTVLNATSPGVCDTNGNGVMSVGDIQTAINQTLGVSVPTSGLTGGGASVVGVQITVNADLGLGCTH